MCCSSTYEEENSLVTNINNFNIFAKILDVWSFKNDCDQRR